MDDQGSCKNDYMWNHSTCDCECNNTCKIDEYSDIQKCSCEKHLLGKLVLGYDNEILNTTETLLIDKKAAYSKSYYLDTISLVIMLLIISSRLLCKALIKPTISQCQH